MHHKKGLKSVIQGGPIQFFTLTMPVHTVMKEMNRPLIFVR